MLILIGIGIGLGAQQPVMAAQTVFKGADMALATSVLIFIQSLSGTVFLSVAENVFQTQVVKQLHQIVPSVDPEIVLHTGASQLHAAMRAEYPDEVDGILKAYNNALQQVFLIAVVLACLTVFGLVGMEWKSLKKAKEEKKKSEIPLQAVAE